MIDNLVFSSAKNYTYSVIFHIGTLKSLIKAFSQSSFSFGGYMVIYLIVLFVVVAVLFGSSAAGFIALRVVLWIVIILGVLSLFGFGFGFYHWRTPIVIASIQNSISYFAV